MRAKIVQKRYLGVILYRLWRAFLLFAGTGSLMVFLLGVFVPHGHLMYVWPVSGIQLGLLLGSHRSRNRVRLEIAAAAGGVFIALLALHVPLAAALVLALTQAAGLALMLRLIRGCVVRFDDLKTRENVLRFFVAAIGIPPATALAAPLLHITRLSFFEAWSGIALSDSLGIAVFTPVVLFLLSGRLWRKDQAFYKFRAGVAASALFLCVVSAVFYQTTNPFLFLIFPPLIVVVFILGVRGGIFISLAVTVIGCWATAAGHGPMWIAQGATPEHRVFVLQICLWTIVATALPVGSLLDEQRAAQQQAKKNQAIYQTLIQNSEDLIVLSNLDGSNRFVSPAVEKVTGWTPQEYLGLANLGGVHPEDRDLARAIHISLGEGKAHHTFRYRALHKNGGFCWVEAFVRGFSDSESGPITGYVATIRDISAFKKTEETLSAEKRALASQNQQLADLAGRDELTGLPNRRTFNHTIDVEAARQSRSSDSLSLLMIDVDSFKKFNDRYGHQAGDVCLQKVARVFKECAARFNDLPARVGGEEFAVLLPQTDEAGAVLVANMILEGIRALRLVHEDSASGFVSVSIGVATWLPFHSSESTQLVQQADRALYQSKRTGRNRLTVWAGAKEVAAESLTV